MDTSELFPRPMGKPILLNELFPLVKKIRSYGQGYKIKWLESNRPHPTLGKDYSQKPTRWLIKGKEHRPTAKQLSVISSFGESFKFSGNPNNAWERMGNSVPPLMMYAIAAQIRHKLWGGEETANYG